MTEEQIKKCRKLSVERDNLVDFRNYLIIHKDELLEVNSNNDRSVAIPYFFRDILINEAEKRIANIDEQLREL